jgi:uncharacterized protein (TIGR03437 family)
MFVAQGQAEDFLAYVAGNVRSPLIGRDADGYIYVAGVANSSGFDFQNPIPHCPNPPCRDEIPTRYNDVVIMKLNPANGEVQNRTYLSASLDEYISAMTVSPQGVVYLAGSSNSPDLPLTADALYPTPSGDTFTGYLARLEPNGTISYLSYFEETSSWHISAMALTPAGELLMTGSSGQQRLAATPGAIDVGGPEDSQFQTNRFIMKLNSDADEILFRVVGVGGGQLALGPDGSIYVSGAASAREEYPTTLGAFQPSAILSYCGAGFFAFPCSHQYVTKIDSEGTRILYSTFVAGEHSDIPNAIAVDAEGYAYLTGTTSSREYPVTEAAFQTTNRSRIPPGFRGSVRAYNAYVTKVSPDGSSLVYSTYLGGIGADAGMGIEVDGDGVATVVGATSSRDFPGSPATHARCEPSDHDPDEMVNREPYPFLVRQAFATRISADGSEVSGTQLLRSAGSNATGLVLNDDGTVLMIGESDHPDLALTANAESAHPEPARTHTGVFLTRLTLGHKEATPDIDCVLEAANLEWVEGVPGGQLLSLFAANTGVRDEHFFSFGPDDLAPTMLGGVRVLFDDVPGFLLYVGPHQINVQTPVEVFARVNAKGLTSSEDALISTAGGSPPNIGSPGVRMDIEVDNQIIHSRVLTRTQRSPTVFVQPDQLQLSCTLGELNVSGGFPLGVVLNEDGSLHSCENPAEHGSKVSFFLTGAGVNPPGLREGGLHSQPVVSLPVPVEVTVNRQTPAEIEFAGGAEGSISGVWRISIRLPEEAQGLVILSTEVAGTAALPSEFGVLVRP